MAKPLVATLTLFIALAYWNDWYNCMLFMSNSDHWNLQYTLQNILNSSEALKRIANQTGMWIISNSLGSRDLCTCKISNPDSSIVLTKSAVGATVTATRLISEFNFSRITSACAIVIFRLLFS